MKLTDAGFRFAPSDLSNHLGCRHVTPLDVEVIGKGRLKPNWIEPSLAVIKELGRAFDRAFVLIMQGKWHEIGDSHCRHRNEYGETLLLKKP